MTDATRAAEQLDATASDALEMVDGGDDTAQWQEYASLCRALALALRNGGGCEYCNGSGAGTCPACDYTGLSDAMRTLLAAAGVTV